MSLTTRVSSKSSLGTVGSIENSGGEGQQQVRVKLPKLEMRKFTGKVEDWQEIWDSFRSAVHNNPGIAKIHKFKYLRSYLEEPARRVIAGLTLTDANYDAAVEILENRFAKPALIKRVHITQLMNLAPVFNERNIGRLCHLLDDIETHFRGLEALKVDKESYSCIVVPVLMDKIPEQIRMNMIRFGGDYLTWTLDEMLDAFAKEVEIKESHFSVFKNRQQKEWTGGNLTRPVQQNQKEKMGTASALFTQHQHFEAKKCPFCYQDHDPEDCKDCSTSDERKKILCKFSRCFLCFKKGHRSFQCRSKSRCSYCKGKHNSLICTHNITNAARQTQQLGTQAQPLNPEAESLTGSISSCSVSCGEQVALQTALARVEGKEKSRVRVLYDSGSQKTFISAKVVNKLDLKPLREEMLAIKKFGESEPEIKKREVYKVTLAPLKGNGEGVKVEAFVVDEISTIHNIHVETIKKDYAHLCNVYFSDVCRSEDILEIDVLIGSNYLWSFQLGEVIRGGQQEPVAVKTLLGWCLSGPVASKSVCFNSDALVSLVIEPTPAGREEILDVNKNLNRLWDLETVGVRIDNDIHQKIIDNISFDGQRYSVGLPWKTGHEPVPSNYGNAMVRLKSQLKKLHRTPEVLKQYDSIIHDQLKDGIIEKVPGDLQVSKVSYLPHQPVVRENAETTKVRIVYDASCKDRSTNTSLNDCLHVGPPLTPLMFDILIRFREQPVVLVGDIEKAFLNIKVHAEDRDCLRFLWVRDIHAKKPDIVVYRFNRVVFEVNSSPFLLNAVIRHHINQYKDVDPQFVECLINSFFVDDLVTSCRDSETAYLLYENAKGRMSNGGFKLHKWKTNDNLLAEQIKRNEGEVKVSESSEEKSFKLEDNKSKVLGLMWDSRCDKLEFNIGKIAEDASLVAPTKRGILSGLATVYDPLGLISPLSVPPRVLFQELCLSKLDWDSSLNPEQVARWEKWIDELKKARVIEAPRCILPRVEGQVVRVSLHGFGDASKKAYCAAVYLVIETADSIHSRLLCSKTRIAPLKVLSIPRLELMAAKILTTLITTVLNALSKQTVVDEVRYWSDSMTVLYWLHNRGDWKTFVHHRVEEILKSSTKSQWGHVSGNENPADLGSRGVPASELKDSKLWWEGPKWLSGDRECWPTNFQVRESVEVSEERKKTAIAMTVTEELTGLSQVVDINRFSKLDKLLRVTAYVKRFLRNLKEKVNGREVNKDRLSVQEIENAEIEWIKAAQKTLKSHPDYRKYKEQLCVIEQNEILVCQGRLEYSELDPSAKNPILLPKNHRFTELVVIDCHEKVHHCKVNATLAELRSRYWVTKGRQFVTKVIRKYFICRKLEGKPYSLPKIAPLPELRVKEAPPFSRIGVDFAGPLYCKGEKKSTKKVYIALFSCCVTRAIHLEVTEDLSACSFLNAFKRFCSRRGTPSLIVSDNAKTFKSTDKLLKLLFSDQGVSEDMESRRIKWQFNLPRCPWAGGLFERMVRSVKGCLRKVLRNAKLSLDELHTMLTEIECTLNSRPLTYQYEDGEVLTPSHLIYGRRFSPFSESWSSDLDKALTADRLTKRVLFLRRKLIHFWKRWKREYLVNLREQHRMKEFPSNVVAKGDIVLLEDDNTKRIQWKMGVVEQLITGKDGQVRGVEVRILSQGKTHVLRRPIQKIYPLEIPGVSVDKKSSSEIGDQKGEMEAKRERQMEDKNEESERTDGGSARPPRAAAGIARCKTRLMLDHA